MTDAQHAAEITRADAAQRDALDELLAVSPVVPVVALDAAADAPALGRALLEGGVGILEVTLRTDAALDAIRALRRALPELRVGCGTVRTRAHIKDALDAGAEFLVAPGAPDALARALREAPAPALPGAATPSEMMALAAHGFARQKFFPAETSGGAAQLRLLAPVFPALRFCPTGGIHEGNAPDYLAAPNVACIGGSWLTPAADLHAQNWDAIRERARAATASLKRG